MVENEKLNIILINRWIGYNEGGNETHTRELIAWLLKRGHRITVITTEGEALKDDHENLKIVYVKSPKKYFSYGFGGVFYAGLFLLKSFLKFLILYFKGNRYDVLSAHFSLEAVLARYIKLFFGIPYVIRLAGDTPLELLEGKRADEAIHVSHFMNEQSKKYGYSAHVIAKGFNLDRFNPDIDVKDLYERHKIQVEDKILLTVCRLDPRKNLITLIEAMNILVNVDGNKNIKLFIVGDGVERKFLENNVVTNKLTENIEFLGTIPNKDPLLAKYYTFADLFVLPTLYEGFGWVFLEAMASGTPVLTTTAGSNPEVVGEDGILIKPKDPQLLAKTISNTLDNPELLKQYKKRGLRKARSIPWEKQIIKYEKVYYKAAQKSCNSIVCRLSVSWFILLDSIKIIKNLLSGVILNKIRKDKSVWKEGGQEGNK